MTPSVLLQLLVCLGDMAFFMLLSGIFIKHARALFLEAAKIPQRTLSSLMQALVVAVGLGILAADYCTLHSLQMLVQEVVRSMGAP